MQVMASEAASTTACSATPPSMGSSLKVGNQSPLVGSSNAHPSSPLLLPSTLAAKPPLSPTQTRHVIEEQKPKIGGIASPSILTKERGLISGRLSSGSASSSVGGSTSSLDSKANPDQLQLQLDRRVQQTSAPASPTTSHVHQLSASAERVGFLDGIFSFLIRNPSH